MAKSKLTPERVEKICNKIKMGLSYKDAALCSGISESAFYEWKARGEQQKSGKYRVFLESIKKANIQAETLHLKNINKCAFGNYIIEETRTSTDKEGITTTTTIRKEIPGIWQASAWMLERRFPERYGKNQALDNESNQPLPWCDSFDGADPLGA